MYGTFLKNLEEKIMKEGAGAEGKTIKGEMDAICEAIESEILNSDMGQDEKAEMLKKLRKIAKTQTNIMLVGATGCGKSSTINALFACGEDEASRVDVAKVGSRTNPETKDIEKYTIGNLVLWDTPGLGDDTENDEHHKTVIRDLLNEEDEDGNSLIDLVLLVMDGSTRDLGTSYSILNDVIIPELQGETNRILVALNQADIAMKTGRHWDYEKNVPDATLLEFLEEKVESIKTRIKDDSGLEVQPVYYCAGYQEEQGEVVYPYNLSKLLLYILNAIPAQKRIAVMESLNTDAENYEYNDDDIDYGEAVKESLGHSLEDFISDGVDKGAEIGGMILGLPGAVVGAIIGGGIGCIRTLLNEIF